MIKGSLAEFSSTLKEANIAGLLEIAKWAKDTTDWKIVAHDIVTTAPFMVGLPCWEDAAGDSCYKHQTANDGYKNLKWELQHLSFMISSMTEMVRLKMKCRVVEIFPTMQKFAVIVAYHNQRWTHYRNSFPPSTFCGGEKCDASWKDGNSNGRWVWERGVVEKFPPLEGPRDVPGYDLCKTQRSKTDDVPGRTFDYVASQSDCHELCCSRSGQPDGKSRREVLRECGQVYWQMMVRVLETSTKQFLGAWKAISNLGKQAQGYVVHEYYGFCHGSKPLGVGKVHTVQQCAEACLKHEGCAYFNWHVPRKVTACNWNCYLRQYPDLKKAFGNSYRHAKEHYYRIGVFLGRDCTCDNTYRNICYFHDSCPSTVKVPFWVAYSAHHGSWRQSAECSVAPTPTPTAAPIISRRRRYVHQSGNRPFG